MIRNPKGQESDQSTFHKGSQGVELQIMVATLGSGNKIGLEDWSLQPKDFMSRAQQPVLGKVAAVMLHIYKTWYTLCSMWIFALLPFLLQAVVFSSSFVLFCCGQKSYFSPLNEKKNCQRKPPKLLNFQLI